MMDSLEEIRTRIDDIDHRMIELMMERMGCAEEVAAYKRAHALPVMDRQRERQLVAKAMASVPDDLASPTAALMNLLMETSRSRQRRLLGESSRFRDELGASLAHAVGPFPTHAFVATQGVEGAFQQMACDRLFRHATLSYFDSFEGVFQAVEEGYCDFGVLPLENSTAGSVNKVYDLMMRHDFHIVRSCRMKIDHNLLAKPGCGLGDVTDIYSHEQAINQCSSFLSGLRGVRVHVCENTAIASRMVAESERGGAAALASRPCAELYGLDVLARNVQDQGNNYTRFACISKEPLVYPGADRSSLMLVVDHEPGALYKVLGKLYALDINIIKLESRPLPDRDFEFMFYFDVSCPASSPDFARLLESLDEVCEDCRYLGSYVEVV